MSRLHKRGIIDAKLLRAIGTDRTFSASSRAAALNTANAKRSRTTRRNLFPLIRQFLRKTLRLQRGGGLLPETTALKAFVMNNYRVAKRNGATDKHFFRQFLLAYHPDKLTSVSDDQWIALGLPAPKAGETRDEISTEIASVTNNLRDEIDRGEFVDDAAPNATGLRERLKGRRRSISEIVKLQSRRRRRLQQ